MKFDIKNLNPGTVFYFDEDKPEDGSVTLRVCNGEALDKIRAATTKKKSEFRKGQRFETVEVDEKKQNELIWDYCVVDWTGIIDADGVEIPCTAENKALLIRGSVEFQAFFRSALDILNDELSKLEAQAEKN